MKIANYTMYTTCNVPSQVYIMCATYCVSQCPAVYAGHHLQDIIFTGKQVFIRLPKLRGCFWPLQCTY